MTDAYHSELFVPNIMSFQNDNTFLGSYQGLRFRLVPDIKADPQTIHAECWNGPLCYELSTMDESAVFSLSEDGIAELTKWLLDRAPDQC